MHLVSGTFFKIIIDVQEAEEKEILAVQAELRVSVLFVAVECS